MNTEELKTAVAKFRWYHEIDLGNGVITKPETRHETAWDLIEAGMKSVELHGKAVLDIGTRDGKYAFAAEKSGASVIAIDNDQSSGALFLKEHFQSKVDFRSLNLYDLDESETFDVILFFGVLYHLRYPMTALRKLTRILRTGGKMHIESAVLNANHDKPMLYCPVKTSPYEITSCTFFNLTALKETLWSFGCTVLNCVTHPSEEGIEVRRAWIDVEKTHEIPDNLKSYWEGKHQSHDA